MNRIRKKIIAELVLCSGVFAFILIVGCASVPTGYGMDKIMSRAEQGDAQAQYELASRYENGNGVKKDIDEALKWYQEAGIFQRV